MENSGRKFQWEFINSYTLIHSTYLSRYQDLNDKEAQCYKQVKSGQAEGAVYAKALRERK